MLLDSRIFVVKFLVTTHGRAMILYITEIMRTIFTKKEEISNVKFKE